MLRGYKMRESIWAGKFYEKGINLLSEQIKGCFLHEKGPGALPGKQTGDKIIAGVVPHAGYVYSGPAAAWVYRAIAESKKPDLFIILGANHQSAKNCLTTDTFNMPNGYVRVDQDFARKLIKKGNVGVDDEAHQKEHSIEVQIPFLQFIYKSQAEKIRILPILVGSESNLKELGVDIKETLVETGKTAIILCSSDFTHYGRNYHYVPFSIDIADNIYKFDGEAMDFVKSNDPIGLLKFCNEKMATICGANALALMLYSVSFEKALLEQYYTSGDLTGDYKNSVSYAAMLFK